ncbi:zinc metalloproteinase nas-13 isoform X3 [Bactrocera oleae]|uniref:zinc metalloproteinase nas-13 isoform X3 n=1 Tax=Bactrocera oleae TaxID=104688 RepID=UPI00387E7142
MILYTYNICILIVESVCDRLFSLVINVRKLICDELKHSTYTCTQLRDSKHGDCAHLFAVKVLGNVARSLTFYQTQMMTILEAFKEYHEKTCIRFRPYEKGDTNWIIIKGNYTGCWSSVGRRQGGQVLNLNTPRCVSHGVIVHELLHALGFYHQQSSTERDEYVKINWENILDGHAHNFNKYARTHITNFGVEYDYQSVMHYSSKAFTKNGKPTIEPLDPYASLGQRKGLSKKDISKLNEMYQEDCNADDLFSFDRLGSYLDELLELFQNSLFRRNRPEKRTRNVTNEM